MPRAPHKATGVGLGLRFDFLRDVVDGAADGRVAFFEIAPENYVKRGDFAHVGLLRVAERFAILSHGLSLSLGGTDALDAALLGGLRELLHRVHAPFHSDHLCFTSHGGVQFHELLPIPFTREAADHTAERVLRAQDALGLPMAVENVTYYAHGSETELNEAELMTRVLERSDAGLLLDLNNLHVNALNYGFDPFEMLNAYPLSRVVQLHVAGPLLSDDGLWIDTHGSAVPERVRELLAYTVERIGPVPVLLERDHDIPTFELLLGEVAALQEIYTQALARHAQKACANSAAQGPRHAA